MSKNGQIVTAQSRGDSVAAAIERMKGELARALPRHVTPDRMVRVAVTAVRRTPKLADCSAVSLLGSVMTAAQLGLEPNTPLGHCYLIPYKDECTLQIGYQGMLDLVRRSGEVRSVYAHAVREGDDFAFALGLEPELRHVPSHSPDRESKPITHVYAVAKLADEKADPIFVVLSAAQIEARRRRSRAATSGPWVTDYEAMCQKTAVRALFRWLPKSIEVASAIELDERADDGRPQSVAWSDATAAALASQGLVVDTSAVDAPDEPAHDPVTGEVAT